MRLEVRSFSLEGPKKRNDDAALLPVVVDGNWWAGIADGVGSSDYGGLAARICLDVIAEHLSADANMQDLFRECARRLDSEAANDPRCDKMGTTLSVLAIRDLTAFIGHVGDTRITHFRGGGVMGRTVDQTEVQKLLAEGALSPHQAKRYPRRNVLLSVMSPGRTYDLFQNQFDLRIGDRLLLSTDGFHSLISRREMATISHSSLTVDEFATKLEMEIQIRGVEDDATAIVAEIMD
jgi:serine/threonine protein phosphatase PrpC